MLSLKRLVENGKDVPSVWIFEYYCKLTEKLTGQDVRICSLFNESDKTPSMFIYFAKEQGDYRFKCFSTGIGGDAYDLVQHKFKIDFKRAAWMVQQDYNRCVIEGLVDLSDRGFTPQEKFRVSDYVKRGWTDKDARFWLSFNIGSSLLERYCVVPLSSYTLTKTENGERRELVKRGDYIYGYFTKQGVLHKIYQPTNREVKFIKVSEYIQGIDQLTGKDTLIIASSLKDEMSLQSLRLELDTIAPDSENTIIEPVTIRKLRKDYRWILSLLDNDKAGIDAMKKYREQFQIPPVYLPLSKDLSDSVRDHTPRVVRRLLVPRIDKHLN